MCGSSFATAEEPARQLQAETVIPRRDATLPVQIEDHDNLSQSDHRLPSIPEREASASHTHRPTRIQRLYVRTPGEFSIGAFGEFSSGADIRSEAVREEYARSDTPGRIRSARDAAWSQHTKLHGQCHAKV